jgi:hypothetical protein
MSFGFPHPPSQTHPAIPEQANHLKILLDKIYVSVVILCVLLRHQPRQSHKPHPLYFRHRDEKPVTANPLESALTNCDARNLFRIRSYKKCGVSPTIASFQSAAVSPSLQFCTFIINNFRCCSSQISPVFKLLHCCPGVWGTAASFPILSQHSSLTTRHFLRHPLASLLWRC